MGRVGAMFGVSTVGRAAVPCTHLHFTTSSSLLCLSPEPHQRVWLFFWNVFHIDSRLWFPLNFILTAPPTSLCFPDICWIHLNKSPSCIFFTVVGLCSLKFSCYHWTGTQEREALNTHIQSSIDMGIPAFSPRYLINYSNQDGFLFVGLNF